MRYLAVFRVALPAPEEPLHVEGKPNLEISLQPGPLEFSYSVPVTKYEPPGATMAMGERRVRLPADSYLVIEVVGQGGNPRIDMSDAALQVAETACLLELRYSGIIAEKVYEGTVNTPGSAFLMNEGTFTLTAQPERDPKSVAAELAADHAALTDLAADQRERYRLAARWFRRGQDVRNPIDKLLYKWVVLEIYPGEGQGKKVVRKTRDLLRERLYPDLAPGTVTSKTGLGRIFDLRGDIVHKGQAFVSPDQQDEFDDHLDRLHAVAVTCLRILAGVAAGDELDKYVRK